MVTGKRNLHIIHLGISGFPHGLGAMQRLILMYRGLASADVKTLVINRKGRYTRDAYGPLELRGVFKEVPYIYLSDTPHRPASFWQRSVQKLKGFRRESRLIRKKKKSGELDVAIVYILGELHYLLYYYLLSRIYRFPIILNYVELNSSFDHRSLLQRLNDAIFDRFSPRLADAFLPISDYLVNHIKRLAPDAPQLKIPVVADFEAFQPAAPSEPPHLVYCGAASYRPLIKFVMEAFEHANVGTAKLHFLLGGTAQDISWVKEALNQSAKKSSYELHVNVPHDQIGDKLAAATALLIPVRPTIQDAARFPHKVGEYLASGTPLVTTAFGEIPLYLSDGVTAYIARSFDVPSYAEKMEDVFRDLARACTIGLAGRSLGISAFDYRKHGLRLRNFIEEII